MLSKTRSSSEGRSVNREAMRISAVLRVVVCMTGVLVAGGAMARSPSSINWVTRGMVSPVKDQGMCGGDYAYVGAGAVNSLHAISGKGLTAVSEQQLLDCASAYGGQG